MALNAFANFDGIPGECTDKAHPDWVTILEMGHAATQEKSPTAADTGGPAAAKTSHAPFRLRKNIDKATPILWEKCSGGAVIPTVKIEMMRPSDSGDSAEKILEIEMDSVIVSKVDLAGKEDGKDVPSEWVDLSYKAINWTYHVQGRDGKMGGTVPAKWNLSTNSRG